MSERGTLEVVTGELVALASPLTALSPLGAKAFLLELGFVLDDAQVSAIAGPLAETSAATARLVDAGFRLDVAVGSDTVSARADTVNALRQVIGSFARLQTALAGLSLPPGSATAADLPRRLFDHLVASYIGRDGFVSRLLELLGILVRTDHNVGVFDPAAPFYTTTTFAFDRIAGWLGDPGKQLGELYGWGSPTFDGTAVFEMVDRLLGEAGLPVLYDRSATPPLIDVVAARLLPRPDLNPRGLELRLDHGAGTTKVEETREHWTATFTLDAALPSGTAFLLQPGKASLVPPDATKVAGTVGVEYLYKRDPGEALTVLELLGLASVSVREIGAKLALAMREDGGADLAITAHVADAHLRLDTSGADGFIAELLGPLAVDQRFDLELRYSHTKGLHVAGSDALEIKLPLHTALGPIDLKGLLLSVRPGGTAFPLVAAADLRATLGPLTALVNELGIKATLKLSDGNLGPVDLQPGFKPPTGIGVSVAAGPVKGGGFLAYDDARGEYAGALELDLAGIVAVKAIGLITTRRPDGKGFSLIVVITAEFGTGLQLGLGFTLLAVGGVLGLNRAMNIHALTEGIRSDAISSVMFPRDVVRDAPRILNDLRTFFPERDGVFVVGPMAKLGWGTPTLVSLSLGVIIEIPGNLAIVGVLRITLPAKEIGLIVLQVNFIGAVEFDRSRFYFFAALYDSRILFLTIEGEMAVLAAFGDDADFVLSVGGFHPSFDPPPLPVPVPKRISVDILSNPVQKLRVEGYFAVTTNTAQFGAAVELRMGFDECGITGALAFDALLQFSPLRFVVTISASISLKAFGVGLFSVRLRLELSGPSPWRARGAATLSLLFFDIDVDFDITWGEARDSQLPPIDVMPLLKRELSKPEYWTAQLPAGNRLLVSLRELDPVVDTLVLHPVGVLRVTQRAVPLDLTIDKVGNQRPVDVNRVTLAVSAGGLTKTGDVDERFAPAQFQELGDADKLARPAFQPMHGGLDLSVVNDQLTSGAMVKRVVRYELTTVDGAFRNHQRFFLIPILFITHWLAGAAVALSALAKQTLLQSVPFEEKVVVTGEKYVVASKATNKVVAAFATEAAAGEHLSQQHAGAAATLHVIPAFEAVA